MEVCETCGQTLPNQAPDTHGTKVGLDQAPDPGGDLEEHSIEFETFESPLQRIKEKNGFLTIKTDSEQRTKISCALVRQRVDDAVDMSKYSIYADMDNCKILLTGIEDDVPTFIISFKTSMAFDKCLKALRPFRPHLNSCVQNNRPIPSNNPRRVGETRTVTPKTLRKLDDGQFQPELATLNEVEIHSIDKWRDEYTQILKRVSDEGSQSREQIYQLRGQSDEERSSSGSEIDMAAVSLEDVDQTILRGRLAKDKRCKKTVSLTSDQYDALQVKKLLNYDKPIITRGGTFDHVTLLEGDEIMTVNGQRSQTIHPECYSLERNSPSETVTITVRSCTRSICAFNIPNNVKGLGITWNNTVVESIGTGPLIQDSVFAPLGQGQDTFCLTHVNGGFIPFYTGREKIYQLLQKAGERVDLVFQPEKRMKAIAEL